MAIINWKFPLRVISRIRSKILDYKYSGGSLGGLIKPTLEGAHYTSSTDYAILADVFKRITIKKSDVLVDVGCGKGRVIFWWLKSGYLNKIYGIELNPEVANETNKRLTKYENVTIITGSILENLPDEANVFYLFNPFDKKTTGEFRDLLEKKLLNNNAEKLTIIYYNCVYVDVFKNNPNWSVDTQTVDLLASGIIGAKLAIIRNANVLNM